MLIKGHRFMWGLCLGLTFSLPLYYVTRANDAKSEIFSELHRDNGGLTNPLLACEIGQQLLKSNLNVSKSQLENFLNKKKNEGKIIEASVYFRDLNNGPWTGVNENAFYIPASLAKMPLAIAIYKKAEADPNFLQKRITYESAIPERETYFSSDDQLKLDSEYSVAELVTRLISNSDNAAAGLLIAELQQNQETLQSVFREIGVSVSLDEQKTLELSVKSYASFFRVLYNASFLNRDSSEKILNIATSTFFDKGIPAGVPKNIRVAHKFGEYYDDTSNIKQLHDCGIVYYERHPYLICVMTRGRDFNNMLQTIQELSSLIYTSVSSSQQ